VKLAAGIAFCCAAGRERCPALIAVRHDPHMDRQSILRCPWASAAGMLGRQTFMLGTVCSRARAFGLTRSSLRLPFPTRPSRRKLGHVTDNIEVPICRDEAIVLRRHRLGKVHRFMTMLSRRRGRLGAVARRYGVRARSSARDSNRFRTSTCSSPSAPPLTSSPKSDRWMPWVNRRPVTIPQIWLAE
jgi:hypothetical protein